MQAMFRYFAIILLSLTAFVDTADADESAPEFMGSDVGTGINGKITPNVEFRAKVRMEKSGGNLRGNKKMMKEMVLREAIFKEQILVDNKSNINHRNLQTANVRVINTCNYDAFTFIIYEKEGSFSTRSWTRINSGSSLTIEGATSPTIWIYGVFANDYSVAWSSSVKSEYCLLNGDCFRKVDLGNLSEGAADYLTCPFIFDSPIFSVLPAPPSSSTESPRSSLQQQWLFEHNSRREAFYNSEKFEDYNLEPVPLKWSDSVAESARQYAQRLIAKDGCHIQHGVDGDSYGGENLAMNSGSSRRAVSRTPSQVLEAWYDDEIDLDTMQLLGQKYHATQVIFRSSRYLGCAQAEKTLDGMTCHIQVCRYVGTGNCFLPAYLVDNFPDGCHKDHPNWVCNVLSDTASSFCTKADEQCPAEGCL